MEGAMNTEVVFNRKEKFNLSSISLAAGFYLLVIRFIHSPYHSLFYMKQARRSLPQLT